MQSLWMVAAGFLFALMGAFVKLASHHFSTPEIVFYRCVFSSLATFALLYIHHIPIRTPHWRYQLWRGASGFASLTMNFYAITLLPLATATTLSYTAPLFLAIYLFLFTKTSPGRGGTAALILGFIGVALLFRPAFHADQVLGELIGLGCGMATGLAYFNVRELGLRGENEVRTVFYFSLLSACLSGLWMFFVDLRPMSITGALILLAVGITGTLAQLSMTRAYRHGNTIITASLAYTTVIFACVFGMLIWHEMLSFDAWLAIIIIITSGLLATLTARKKPAARN